MPAPLYAHIRKTSSDHLLVILAFFDHPNLRRYYTGLIADVRRELAERGVDIA
jgi:hypothetical protein